MEATLRYSKVSRDEYLKLGRLNLWPRPKSEMHPNASWADEMMAEQAMKKIAHASISLGADVTYVLAMGSRVSRAICDTVEFHAKCASPMPPTSWLQSLKAGTVRSTDANVFVGWFAARVRIFWLPHPSGLSRCWNDPKVRETAGDAMRFVIEAIDSYPDLAAITSCKPVPNPIPYSQ